MSVDDDQKTIFIDSEADAWFDRNQEACAEQDFSIDLIASAIIKINGLSDGEPLKILEIGCGEGRRLSWIADQIGAEIYGIEPSEKAIAEAVKRGVTATKGTADTLLFDDGKFDIVVFGFCLYLCDPVDLFKIAQEADRVLKTNAWLIIRDFHASEPMKRPYHHKDGLFSHKMDYRKLFDWHPSYTCYEHQLAHHVTRGLTDDPQEWVATSLIRKSSQVQ